MEEDIFDATRDYSALVGHPIRVVIGPRVVEGILVGRDSDNGITASILINYGYNGAVLQLRKSQVQSLSYRLRT